MSGRASAGPQEGFMCVREDAQRCCIGQKGAQSCLRVAVSFRKGEWRGMRHAM